MFWIETHWVALFSAIFLYLFIGGLWYSPFLFGETWRDSMAFRPEKLTPPGKAWVGATISGLITAYVLSLFIRHTGAITGMDGIKVAFLAWLGFTVPTQFGPVLWENRPFRIFLIHAACMLVTLLMMGFVLASW
jgi:hypothetical protein